ncbi:MAG: pimeloyl-ACP methyl ester carboxylesterase [Planctomycetota bacterium]|jgi:pimeloyl-ACP methyl ester carboxylesterase
MNIRTVTISLALIGFTALHSLAGQDAKPPTRKQLKTWTKEYLEMGSRAMGEERVKQLEILAALKAGEPLTPRAEESWRKKLGKAWTKLPELPFDKGDGHYWEDEKRGRYIVGGKTKKPVGLLIAMHGGGVGSADASGAASMYGPAATENKWVMIAPQALEATERGWTDSGTEEWIWDLVEQARRTYKVDANNVVLCGHSMGGYGSWTLGAHHADRVAALAPAAGAPTPVMLRGTEEIIDIDWGVVPSLRNVPMVVFQSIDDPRVPPGPNQHAAKEVAKAKEKWGGYEGFEYWELDGFAHSPPPGGPKAHFERLTSLVRQPVQDVVIWQPVLDWKRQFYWLFWEQPAEGAIVEARIDRAANKISVQVKFHKQAEQGKGLAVLLDETLVDMDKEVVVEYNGQEVFRGLAQRRLEVLFDTATSGDPGRLYSCKIPLQ